MPNNKIFLFFFGPPGAGKGTQAGMLAEKIGLPVISTGNLLRREIESGSELGRAVRPLLDKGRLVDDRIAGKIIERRLRRSDAARGAIFDGYPRNAAQQDFILSLLQPRKSGGKISEIRAVLIKLSDREVLRRLGGRRICSYCGAVYHLDFNPPRQKNRCDRCGHKLIVRDDDKKRVIRRRLKIYHRRIKPMLGYFRQGGRLIEINGGQKIEKVRQDIAQGLKDVIFKH